MVGITTFGNDAALYSSVIEDVIGVVENIEAGVGRAGSTYRPFPRTGGRWDAEIRLAGPWDQALYAAWLNGGAVTEISASRGLGIEGIDIGFGSIARGTGSAEITWFGLLPGFVAVEAAASGSYEWSSNHPLSRFEDPDDGRTAVAGEPVVGIFDVPGDRDFYYLEVPIAGVGYEVEVAMRSRGRITVWGPDGQVVATEREDRGFLFADPRVDFVASRAGTYVVAVQETGVEVGPYELVVR